MLFWFITLNNLIPPSSGPVEIIIVKSLILNFSFIINNVQDWSNKNKNDKHL